MSICNVDYTADRVLIGVDTAVTNNIDGLDESPPHGIKPIILGRAVAAARGNVAFLYALSASVVQMQSAGGLMSMDSLEPMLDALLPHAREQVQQMARAHGVALTPEMDAVELTFAGWSQARRQMRACVATLDAGELTVEHISAQCIAPGVPDLVSASVGNDAAMMEVARKQTAYFEGERAIGGELMVYDLRPDGIVVRYLGKI